MSTAEQQELLDSIEEMLTRIEAKLNVLIALHPGARELLERRLADIAAGLPQCRVCGCTDNAACEDGCHWVESDLCSACAP